MSQVYYRKWRPRTFSELVGQDHVSTTLRQALKTDRVAHAYLLCGPRGTGKTTSARILAKTLNCGTALGGEPCNSCGSCIAVEEGRCLDLIELDAASNRGIDEIRKIRDRVHLAPSEGRYKVFIIDEAHMLTREAANAFLKTLEEPPPHVIFALCTTESDKMLPTIISRCQRFDFRRLASRDIVDRLITISEAENIEVEEDTLRAISQASEGSLRDAENLLEQLAMSAGDSRVTLEDVRNLLGFDNTEESVEFLGYTLAGNTAAALSVINRCVWDGSDLPKLLTMSVNLLRGILVLQWVGNESSRMLDFPEETVKAISVLANNSSKDRVVTVLRSLSGVSFKHDSPSPLPLELAVIETSVDEKVQTLTSVQIPKETEESNVISTVSDTRETKEVSRKPESIPENREPLVDATIASLPSYVPSGATELEPVAEKEMAIPTSLSDVQTTSGADSSSESTSSRIGESEDISPEKWGALVKSLSRNKGKRFNVGALLRDCNDQHLDDGTLVLTFRHRTNQERMQQELDDPQSFKAINDAVAQLLGASFQVRLATAGNAKPRTASSPMDSLLVRTALGMGGRILEEKEL